MLAKSKSNIIDTLISQASIDMDISHEEFITIFKEKDRYEMMKDKLRHENRELYGIMRFSSTVKKNYSRAYIKVKYYWASCTIKKIIFLLAYI